MIQVFDIDVLERCVCPKTQHHPTEPLLTVCKPAMAELGTLHTSWVAVALVTVQTVAPRVTLFAVRLAEKPVPVSVMGADMTLVSVRVAGESEVRVGVAVEL